MDESFILANPFRSLVGLRNIDTTSQSWVNDLPGLSTELVGDLAQPSDLLFGDEQESPAAAVWEGVHRNAYERLLCEMLLILSENYDFQPIIARTLECAPTLSGVQSSGRWLGLKLIAPYVPNTLLTIRSMTILVKSTALPIANATIKVIDLNTYQVVKEFVCPIIMGANLISIGANVPVSLMQSVNVVVLIDAAGLTLAELTPPVWNADNDAYSVSGVTSSSSEPDLFNSYPAPDYLSVEAEITRSIDSLLARYSADLKTAYNYLCGSLLMTEKLASPNLSAFTLSNPQFTERMEGKLFDDFKRALRPVVRRLSNELLPQQALTIPVATPNEITYIQGSYV